MTIFLWLPLYAVALMSLLPLHNSVLAAEQEQAPQDHDGRINATVPELRENDHPLPLLLFSGDIAFNRHAEVGTYSESILGTYEPWMVGSDREDDPSEVGTESMLVSDDESTLVSDDDNELAASMPCCVQGEDTGEIGTVIEEISDGDDDLAAWIALISDGPPGELPAPVGRGGAISGADKEVPEEDASGGDVTASPQHDLTRVASSDGDTAPSAQNGRWSPEDLAMSPNLLSEADPQPETSNRRPEVAVGGKWSPEDMDMLNYFIGAGSPEVEASEGNRMPSPQQICDIERQQVDLRPAPSAHHESETEAKQYVEHVHELDVLPGRGGLTNGHPGNRRFLQIVEDHKLEYANIKENKKKTKLAKTIVEAVSRNRGRFLDRDKNDRPGKYFLMSWKKARKKTSQALREEKKASK